MVILNLLSGMILQARTKKTPIALRNDHLAASLAHVVQVHLPPSAASFHKKCFRHHRFRRPSNLKDPKKVPRATPVSNTQENLSNEMFGWCFFFRVKSWLKFSISQNHLKKVLSLSNLPLAPEDQWLETTNFLLTPWKPMFRCELLAFRSESFHEILVG